tara:strand:+ start:32106 stop:33320 length:1215 start_codon:yes stop_codon:yes gene_type:complete
MPFFPSGIVIDPERSRVTTDQGFDSEVTHAGDSKLVRRRQPTVTFNVVLHAVTETQRDELRTFYEANRGSDVDLIYDNLLASGRVRNRPIETRKEHNFYEVAFTLVAKLSDVGPIPPPYTVVVSGQSNALGRHPVDGDGTPAVEMILNPNVSDWQSSTSQRSTGGGSGFEFKVADPDRAEVPGYTAFAPMVGMLGQGIGNIGWFFANRLSTLRSRRVNIIQINRGGAPIEFWIDDTESIRTEMNLQISAALASLGVSQPDFFIWLQGESNTSGGFNPLTPAAYATKFQTLITAFESQWLGSSTRVLVCDIGEGWSGTGPTAWDGNEKATEASDLRTHFISSADLPEFDSGGGAYHFTGPGLKTFGERAADKASRLIDQGTEGDWILWDSQWNDDSRWIDTGVWQ